MNTTPSRSGRLRRVVVAVWTAGALVAGLLLPAAGPAAAEAAFVGVGAPRRLLESRVGAGFVTVDGLFEGLGVRSAGETTALQVGGRGGVASSARVAVLTVTVVEARAPLFVTVFACDRPRPLASNVNAGVGQTVANTVVTELSGSGEVCVYTDQATDLVVDVTGVLDDVPGTDPELDAVGCPVGADRWSDPATWGGTVPGTGASVVVPAGRTVGLDVDTAALAALTVDGTLAVCDGPVSLTAGWVMVHGTLRAGTETTPHDGGFTVTLTGTGAGAGMPMGMGTRGLGVMGGTLDLHGPVPATTRTVVTATAPAGATQLQVASAAGWAVGDTIAVAPTDYYGASETEVFTIAALAGNTVTLDHPLASGRWGRLQYVTPGGLSLAGPSTVTPPASPTPLVLDERATVVNLSRDIVIQGPDDARWNDDGFGAHVMVMGLASDVRVEGVELRRVGQLGELGRYPIHWHRLSYSSAGTLLGDATGHYLRGSAIHGSTNRCVTIHATNGVEVDANACIDIVGHAVFTEDAVERRNTITGNVVLGVRNPPWGEQLRQNEVEFQFGASGFWLSNPDNTVDGNLAADAQGFGFWLAYPEAPVGPSATVAMRPDRLRFGSFDDNTTHSNHHEGVMFDNAEVDDAGNVEPNQYFSTSDGQDPSWPFDTLERFEIRGLSVWKNERSGVWTRATWPTYTEFVSADNGGRFFAGSGAEGLIHRSLVVGTSLNAPTPRPAQYDSTVPTAFASYHSAFDMRENVLVAFPLVPGERSGAFATDDYYVRPVDKGHIRNPDNLLIGSDPGYRSPRPSPNFAFAGALWDPHGTWGAAGTWNTYDDPFLTHDATCSPVLPAGSNAVSCDGDYYGVMRFQLDQGNEPWEAYMPIEARRYSDTDSLVGTWAVGPGYAITNAFGNMRHFAARHGGRYELDFPDSTTPTDVVFELENMDAVDRSFVIGVEFDGAESAQVFTTTWDAMNAAHAAAPDSAIKHNYVAVGSRQDVIDTPGTFWQDVAGDRVWIHLRGGLDQAYVPPGTLPTDDLSLYDVFRVRIH